MIRLMLRLLGIRDYEVCQSCQTLKEQLLFERDEKKRLTDTLINIVNPKVVESIPVEINPVVQTSGLFSRRRAAAEERDRQAAQILRNSTNLGKADDKIREVTPKPIMSNTSVNDLEKELGVEEGA